MHRIVARHVTELYTEYCFNKLVRQCPEQTALTMKNISLVQRYFSRNAGGPSTEQKLPFQIFFFKDVMMHTVARLKLQSNSNKSVRQVY